MRFPDWNKAELIMHSNKRTEKYQIKQDGYIACEAVTSNRAGYWILINNQLIVNSGASDGTDVDSNTVPVKKDDIVECRYMQSGTSAYTLVYFIPFRR